MLLRKLQIFLKVTALSMLAVVMTAWLGIPQEIRFEASVDTTRTDLGSVILLTLTFEGAKPDGPPELPKIDGLEARYLGPSSRISIINGQVSTRVGYMYNLFPTKTGKFRIPAIKANVAGQTLTSQPIDLEVVDASKAGSPGTGAESTGTNLNERIFLIMEIPKKQVYVYERLPVTIKLFIQGLAVRDIQYPQFQHEGFFAKEYGQPKEYQATMGESRYQVIEFNTAVYPTSSGSLTLGPGKLGCNILFESSGRRRFPRSGFDSLFEDDFFEGFFDHHEKRPMTVSSVELPVEVLSFPEEGKPADFSGAVGTFSFEASVSPSEVDVGDPLTLRMKVIGDAYWPAVGMPSLKESENLKLYEPQIKDQAGQKTLEQVLIPKSEKITEIPAIRFTYFDKAKKAYQTVTQGPFPIKVKSSPREEFKVVGFDQSPPPLVEEKLGQDIVFIKEQPGKWRRVDSCFYKSPFLLAAGLVLVLGGAALEIVYRRNQKLKADVRYRRRLQAPGKAKKALENARRFMAQGKDREFYEHIFKSLQEYLGDHFHLASGAITFDVVAREFENRHLKRDVLTQVKALFEECDRVRYASFHIDGQKMQENLRQLQEIIDYLERTSR